jgi:hypothetical protein
VRWFVRSVVTVALLAGCHESRSVENDVDGGSHPSPSRTYGRKCPVYEPCGGDLVGTWVIADHCGWHDEGFGSKECGLYSWFDGETTGTMTFNADGRYATNLGGTSVYIEDAPLESPCGGGGATGGFDTTDAGASASQDSGAPTCEERERIERLLLGRIPVQDAVSVSCATHGARCTCTWVRPPPMGMKTGTYSVDDSELTIGEGRQRYCVKGNELFLIDEFPSDFSGYSVRLTRQR